MAKLRYKIPPPNHLITFEAAGRCLNFTRAAEELNVSRVSVSQQIKALEDRLGVKLFLRTHKSLKLTAIGARYYGIPWRTNGAKTGSKQDDLYAGYDSILKVYPAILGGCNLLTHCGGTIEGSLCISMGKLAADAQQILGFQMMLKGSSFKDMDIAIRDLKKVDPGGHFFDEDYTREHMPFLDDIQDNERYESWIATGSKSVSDRGRDWCKTMLGRYEDAKPSIDPAISEELRAYVTKRETEIPAGVS